MPRSQLVLIRKPAILEQGEHSIVLTLFDNALGRNVNVVVRIVEGSYGRVKVGIMAPPEVNIARMELWERSGQQNDPLPE